MARSEKSKTFKAKLAVISVSMPRTSHRNTGESYQIVELLDPTNQKIWITYVVDDYLNQANWQAILDIDEQQITTVIDANWKVIKDNIISADARPEIWRKFVREDFAQTLAEYHGDPNNRSYT